MLDTNSWKDRERVEFKDETFGVISIPSFDLAPDLSFNTELHFENCILDELNATCLLLGKRISLRNCTIKNGMGFYSTYFFGGFEMYNCKIQGDVTFSCGVHNLHPNRFALDNCSFENYVDFFDVYFEGPTIITSNKFVGGSNLELYLGNAGADSLLEVSSNEGNLKMTTNDDPFFAEKQG